MKNRMSLPLVYALCASLGLGVPEIGYQRKKPKEYAGPAKHPGIRNPKVAANVDMMYRKWAEKKGFPA